MRRITALRYCLPLFLLLTGAVAAAAQQASQPPAGSNWQHVSVLPVGTGINVKAKSQHINCNFKSADADTLTCSRGFVGGKPKEIVFQRGEVKVIKINHRVRSTLVGTGIGAGTGAVVGFAVGTSGNDNGFFGKNFLRGAVTAVFGVGGAVIGATAGALTDFTKSTVYRAP